MANRRCDLCQKRAAVVYTGPSVNWYACLKHDSQVSDLVKMSDEHEGLLGEVIRRCSPEPSPARMIQPHGFSRTLFLRNWIAHMFWSDEIENEEVPGPTLTVIIYKILERRKDAVFGQAEVVRHFDAEKGVRFHAEMFVEKFIKNTPVKSSKANVPYRQECHDLYRDDLRAGEVKWFAGPNWQPPLGLNNWDPPLTNWERALMTKDSKRPPVPGPAKASWIGKWQELSDRLAAILEKHGVTRFSTKAEIIEGFFSELPKS